MTKTTFTDVNTGATIIIDTEATEIYSEDAKTGVTTVNRTFARMYNELLKKFIDNNFAPIIVDMPTSTITINAYSDRELYISSLKDCTFFSIDNGPRPFMNSNSLVKITKFLADWENICKETEKQKADLQKFFEKKIKEHNSKMLATGNNIVITMANENKTRLTKNLLQRFQKETGLNPDEIKTAVRLANDWQTYSDQYKTLYGSRPKFS